VEEDSLLFSFFVAEVLLFFSNSVWFLGLSDPLSSVSLIVGLLWSPVKFSFSHGFDNLSFLS